MYNILGGYPKDFHTKYYLKSITFFSPFYRTYFVSICFYCSLHLFKGAGRGDRPLVGMMKNIVNGFLAQFRIKLVKGLILTKGNIRFKILRDYSYEGT